MIRRLAILLCLQALLAALLAPGAWASQPAQPQGGSFSVVPTPDQDIENPKNPARERVSASRSWFTFRAEPGQVIHDSLRIVNTGQVPLELLVYAVDATTGVTTGMVMHNRDAPRAGVSTWVRVSEVAQPTLRLEPGKVVDVEFAVSVPAEARPGEHWGGLMVEDTFVRKGSGQFAVHQVFRSGVALGVTLPGPRVEKLVVRGISSKVVNGLNQVFVIELANEGNVLLKSRGALELKDGSGKVVGRHELNLDNVLPGTSVPYELFWPKESLPTGKYQASVTLTYSPDARPAALQVPELVVEAPGMRLVAATPSTKDEAAAFAVVPASAPAQPQPQAQPQTHQQAQAQAQVQAQQQAQGQPRESGPWQSLLAGVAGAAVVGGGMLVYQFVRRARSRPTGGERLE